MGWSSTEYFLGSNSNHTFFTVFDDAMKYCSIFAVTPLERWDLFVRMDSMKMPSLLKRFRLPLSCETCATICPSHTATCIAPRLSVKSRFDQPIPVPWCSLHSLHGPLLPFFLHQGHYYFACRNAINIGNGGHNPGRKRRRVKHTPGNVNV